MDQLGSFILDHWLLFLALAIVLGLLIMNLARERLLGFREIKPQEMLQMMNRDDPVVVDTRSAEEYASGHVLGARNIPHDRFADRLGELEPYRERKIIVYCRTGQRASTAASQLVKAGFPAVFKLNGGMLAWTDAGLPVTREANKPTPEAAQSDAPAQIQPPASKDASGDDSNSASGAASSNATGSESGGTQVAAPAPVRDGGRD